MVSPSARRRAAKYLVEGRKCSIQRACRAMRLARSTFYRRTEAGKWAVRLERRIKALSFKHPREGYRFITQRLRGQGWLINRKRVQRIRRREQLQIVRKSRKIKRVRPERGDRLRAQRPNQVWSYDFIHDQLETGVPLKMLTVLDEFTRECVGILVERSITATGVVGFLERLMLRRGVPEHVRSDNGPEFTAETVKTWVRAQGIKTNYIEPGSPWENGHVESFHDKFRDRCLNREVFGNLLEAKVIVEDWRRQYNEKRPHSSLGYKTPREFARQSNFKLRVATLPCA